MVIAAGIDCTANPINGRTTNIPVKEFVKLFFTEPVGAGSGSGSNTFDIFLEIVGSAETGSSGTGGIFHDVVQLYR